MVAYERKDPDVRREQMIAVALELAAAEHFLTVTPSKIGEQTGVTRALVSHYFGNMAKLHAVILYEAIKRDVTAVIEQGQLIGMITNAGNLKRTVSELVKNI